MTHDIFDALVVLGGSTARQSEALIGIADSAAHAFRSRLTSSIIATGCCHHTLDIFPGRTEAQCLRDLLMARDVPSGNIFTEERSADLLGRCLFSQQEILIPCAWYHLLVLCPGAVTKELRNGIEALFTDDFSIEWLDSEAAISETHRLDLEDISLRDLPERHQIDLAVPRLVTAKGAPQAGFNR